MTNNIKNLFPGFILLIFSLFLFAFQISGQENESQEREKILEIRHPAPRAIDPGILQELRSDSEMDYDFRVPDDNMLAMFRSWLFHRLLELFGSREAVNNLEVIMYSLAVLVLVYAVLRLLKIDLSGLIGKRARKAMLSVEAANQHEDINEIDFGRALSEALTANEFHKAIRLLYLSALKELADREHIQWQAGKTNYQYQQELRVQHLQSPFRELGYFFEYAWYGNFNINEHHFKEAERSYQSLHQNLNPNQTNEK